MRIIPNVAGKRLGGLENYMGIIRFSRCSCGKVGALNFYLKTADTILEGQDGRRMPL